MKREGIKLIRNEMPVACSHTVFTKKQREEYAKIWGELETRRFGITELENGFQYEFSGDPETLRLINEWVNLERKCCPFLTFSVIASNEAGPVLLQLTGNQEAKAFLQADIQANINLITGQS
jgi:hypothetical protein